MEEVTRELFEKLKQNPMFSGVVVTDSMTPLIQVGEKVIVEVGTENLNRFDIVIILQSGKLVCHYVWAINRFFQPILMQTRNLKNGGRDFPVSLDDCLGKVVSHKLRPRDFFRIFLSQIFRD